MQLPSIVVGEKALPVLSEEIAKLKALGEQVLLVTSESCLCHHGALIEKYFPQVPVYLLPSGEEAKTLTAYTKLILAMAALPMGRKGALIALGGGSVLDAAGFAAATYARGIALHSVPTTLLAMADAAVGGKTGLNLPEGKNLIGSFYPAQSIAIDPAFLKTLPPAEFASGMAEVIKVALLGAPGLWERLHKSLPLTAESSNFLPILEVAIQYKARVVEVDPFEKASAGLSRSFLNLGHTFAHAIEAVTRYSTYRHGEAVAIGLMLALALSEAHLGLTPAVRSQLKALLEAFNLPTALPSSINRADLLKALSTDKKAQGGRPRFVLLKALGEPCLVSDVPLHLVEAVLA